jgi:hypothetical protein
LKKVEIEKLDIVSLLLYRHDAPSLPPDQRSHYSSQASVSDHGYQPSPPQGYATGAMTPYHAPPPPVAYQPPGPPPVHQPVQAYSGAQSQVVHGGDGEKKSRFKLKPGSTGSTVGPPHFARPSFHTIYYSLCQLSWRTVPSEVLDSERERLPPVRSSIIVSGLGQFLYLD